MKILKVITCIVLVASMLAMAVMPISKVYWLLSSKQEEEICQKTVQK